MQAMATQPWSIYARPSTSDIQWDSTRCSIVVGQRAVQLTPTEYRRLFTLRHGVPVTYADITHAVYRCNIDAHVRIMLDKHIDRIRGKLRATGFYVHCVLTYGYMLLPTS